MFSATTSDEKKGLFWRLIEELLGATREFTRDPRSFIRDLIFDSEKDTKRRRMIRMGLLYALGIHIAFIGITVILGWHRIGVSAGEQTEYIVTMIPSTANPHEAAGDLRGEKPRGREDGGGGGGGQNSPLPASGGVRPQISPAPQIVHPLAPTSPAPVLPIPATVVGPQSDAPPPNATIGVPTGAIDAPPSPGPGTGGGMGNGQGTGVGNGSGPGAGPGSGGSEGGGNQPYGSPNGKSSITGPIDWRRPPRDAGYTPFAWIYKARAIVTPEAQANKVNGVVLLRATFRSDGTITDIVVVNPVPFMTEAAIEALRRSKFRPAAFNGVPVTLTNVLIKQEVHYGN